MRAFLEKTTEKIENKSAYHLAKLLDVNHPSIFGWRGDTGRGEGKQFNFSTLKKLREKSGLSWSEFGKIFDEEF